MGWLKKIFETLFLSDSGGTEKYNMKVKTDGKGNVTDVIYWKGKDSSGHGHVWGIDKDPGGRSSKD